MQSLNTKDQRSTILIVDDQIDNIQVLALVLESHGYSVTYALSGEETFSRLQSLEPDLILLDYFLPGMDGIQICEKLKAHPSHQDIPVLFLTASHDEDHLIAAFDNGAADYLTKPFKVVEVLARVKSHIRIRQQAKALRQSRHKLETIVNYVKDGILVVDAEGLVQFANPAAAYMFQRPMSELLGHQIGIPVVEKKVTQIEILRLNGDLGQAEINAAETEWEDQPAWIVSMRDISDRYDVRMQLR